MTTNERDLLALLKRRSFLRGHFILSSGAEADYYLDVRKTSISTEGAYLIGEVLRLHTEDFPRHALGGMAVGAVPLVTATVIAFGRQALTIEGFWVRDFPKAHGTEQLIEGNFSPGMRVVIVEDVASTGVSALKAVEAARAAGGEVVAVVALVDRLMGAGDRVRAAGVGEYRSVFTIRDFGVEPAFQESVP